MQKRGRAAFFHGLVGTGNLRLQIELTGGDREAFAVLFQRDGRLRLQAFGLHAGLFKLQRDVITRWIFNSTKDLDKKLMRYIRQYNKQAVPLK